SPPRSTLFPYTTLFRSFPMKVLLKIFRAAVRSTLLCVFTITMFAGQYAAAQAVDPGIRGGPPGAGQPFATGLTSGQRAFFLDPRSEEHTSELQSRGHLV